MAFISVQVAGPVIAPTGLPPHAAKIEFRLRTRVTAGDTLAVPQIVTENVVEGEIDVALIGSSDGVIYDVYYLALLGASVTRVNIGPIVLDGPGPYTLAELLPIPIPYRDAGTTRFKQGDTLDIGITLIDHRGRAQDLTGQTITSDLRGPDGVDRPLTVLVDADPKTGRVAVSLTPEQTAVLPLGRHTYDIRRQTGTQVHTGPTDAIEITERITE